MRLSNQQEIDRDMEAYDQLPKSVREYLANHKSNVPAHRFLQVLENYGYDEQSLWAWVRSISILNK